MQVNNRSEEEVPSRHASLAEYARHLHPTVVQYVNNERIAVEYDDFFLHNRLFEYDCQILLQELRPRGRVLDAGCGSGRHLIFLEQHGFEMHGLDLSPHFLSVARKKLEQRGLPVRLRQGDLLRPPVDLLPQSEKFDGIIMMFSVLGMICGAGNRRQALEQLRAWLAPGGVFVAHVHNRHYSVSQIMERLRRLKGMLPFQGDIEEGDHVIRNYRGIMDLYLHSFSRDELTAVAREAGFLIRKVIPLNARRDGICESGNIVRDANGFILVAENPAV